MDVENLAMFLASRARGYTVRENHCLRRGDCWSQGERTQTMTKISVISVIVFAVFFSCQLVVAQQTDDDLVRRAFNFGFPVYEMMRVRSNSRGLPNTLTSRTTLTGPKDRGVTAPNNDTLYASAWLDLAAGPVQLDMPPLPNRYHSVHFMDLFTDAFAIAGTREDRGRGARFLVIGPEWSGSTPPGMRILRSPTNDAWMLVRVLVDGPEDLSAAVVAQRKFLLSNPRSSRPFDLPTPTNPTPEIFLKTVNAALARSPVPPTHRTRLAEFGSVGLGPQALTWEALPAETKTRWYHLFMSVRDELRSHLAAAGSQKNGWVYPRSGLGRFGEDDEFRAAVALGGLGALPEEEALYLHTSIDGAGAALDGRRSYRLVIPKETPIDGFWSLTMYEPDGTGRWFLYENEAKRYSIGDRSRDIIRQQDGSIGIVIQTSPPKDPTLNWLPAPPGLFKLSFRAYLPHASFRDGRYVLPPVTSVERHP
ncbi:MAG: DUF1254 domain-containing protein [Gammaproteobacteria bacterium]|nr:DUF1254 domain-containing protein [Gammaproteobacteria bacterium]